MKTRGLVALGVVVVSVFVGFKLLNRHPDANALLVFRGYTLGTTNGTQVANFELRNTTGRAIWLCYSGTQWPLRPPFLERPMAVLTNQDDTQETNVYSINVGHFFTQGEEVLPGSNVLLECPLTSRTPASQIGVEYYTGRFKDGNDFLRTIMMPLSDPNGSLKAKGEFYWEKLQRSLKAPKCYEIWCPEPVCFQATLSDSAGLKK